MGLLGALIVFAPRPLYAGASREHGAPGASSPLADQQLAGLLMWVPAILPYLGVGLWLAWSSLRRSEPALVTTFLKFVHLATIAHLVGRPDRRCRFCSGSAGTVAEAPELDRLHRITRFVYVGMTSPAAFVAIGSGTALIFLQATFQEWFSLKMVLVGAMVMLHVVAGLVLGMSVPARRPVQLASPASR